MPNETAFFYLRVENGQADAVRLCGAPHDPQHPDTPGGRCVRPWGHHGAHRTQEDYREIERQTPARVIDRKGNGLQD